MRRLIAYGIATTGLLLIMFGIFTLFDGILPMRSHGPNPLYAEIVTGILVGGVGWFIRYVGVKMINHP